ncbi:MAG: M48 family metallopeptidase [Clostridiales bacterium]|jgi:predicted metal-dependent hydrolase|nr:M48 family metallopeptidase [Clostridiales bacterium]
MEYTVQRTNRKTISLQIKSGTLTVRAPLNCTNEVVEAFVQSKKQWIVRQLANYSASQLDSSILQFKNIYLSGKLVQLQFKPNINSKLLDGVLQLNEKYKENPKPQLRKYLYKVAENLLFFECERVAKILSLQYKQVALSYARTKWGSCDNKQRILLNYRLVMLPRHLMLYVVVHELCHLVHHNHSSAFWTLLASICPQFKQYKKELKQWGQLNHIY